MYACTYIHTHLLTYDITRSEVNFLRTT